MPGTCEKILTDSCEVRIALVEHIVDTRKNLELLGYLIGRVQVDDDVTGYLAVTR